MFCFAAGRRMVLSAIAFAHRHHGTFNTTERTRRAPRILIRSFEFETTSAQTNIIAITPCTVATCSRYLSRTLVLAPDQILSDLVPDTCMLIVFARRHAAGAITRPKIIVHKYFARKLLF
jgi:hypothetical protein